MSATEAQIEDLILPGRGLLGMMLSWLKPAAPTEAGTGEDQRFDPAQLMRGLLQYERRHRARLRGSGLVIGLAADLPPPALDAVSRQRGYQGATDLISFNSGDYSGDGYQSAMEKVYADLGYQVSEFDQLAPRQAAHLANAVCVRAAVQMATFALGIPLIKHEPDGTLHVEFVPPRGSGLPVRSVHVESNSNAMGVAKVVKESLGNLCSGFFRSVIVEVGREFDVAVRAGLSKNVAGMVRSELLLSNLPAVTRMLRSFQTFSNLRGLYEANTRFIAELSRPALSDALRHSRAGSTLGAYGAHLDQHVAAETAAARSLGALAFCAYSRRTLRLMWRGHTYREPDISMNGASAPAPRDPSAVSAALLSELNRRLHQPAREQLSQLSPQFLAQLVIGTGRVRALGQERAFEEDAQVKAARAGRRLAAALNAAADPEIGLKGLPWAGVLASGRARQLLIEDMPDEDADQGLRSLIAYANAQRAKGRSAKDVVHNLPNVEDLVAAPPASAATALERLQGAAPGTVFRAAHRSAMELLDTVLSSLGPIRSSTQRTAGSLSGEVEWRPALVGFNTVSIENLGSGSWEDPSDPRVHEDFWQRRGLVIALRDVSGKHWMRHTLDAAVDEQDDGTLRLLLNVYEHPSGSLPIVDGARASTYRRQHLHGLPGSTISNPHSPPTRKFPERMRGAQAEHSQALVALWKDRLKEMIRRNPAEMAALLPPVAGFILSGRDSPARPVANLGAARGLRLARVSMAMANAQGFELIVTRMRDPLARTAGGASLLDIALESPSTHFARAGLQALAQHPTLQRDAEALKNMVQNSLGKLVERHPGMLPLAAQFGVVPDSATLAAWDALHPLLKSPEVSAGMTAARMRAVIESTVRRTAGAAAMPNDPPAAPRRRRAGL